MSDKRGGVTQVIDVSVPEEINHLRGQKVDVLNNPQGPVRTLYLECEAGEYRIRVGDISAGDMPGDAIPPNEVNDGTGSLSMREGMVRAIPAPDDMTVRGLTNKSVLTYYWV